MMIWELVLCGMLVLVGSLIVHELGHILYLKLVLERWVRIQFLRDRSLKIVVGEKSDYGQLTKLQLYWTYASGVIAGGAFILAWSYGVSSVFSLLTLPYAFFCREDLKNIIRLYGPASRE